MSSLPVTMVRPSGLNLIGLDARRPGLLERRADRLSRGHVPESHDAVVIAGRGWFGRRG